MKEDQIKDQCCFLLLFVFYCNSESQVWDYWDFNYIYTFKRCR